MSNWLRRLSLILALTACLPLFAQEFRAGISGIVKDAQGAVVPGAPVEAQSVSTNEVAKATTNEAGAYSFPVLPIGTYRVTVSAPGFKKAVQERLELRVGDQVQQDFTLDVGMVTEQVTVSAGVELLQAIASDKGQVVGQENVEDLPSQARNPFLLGIVATGVQFDIGANAISRSARPFDAGNNVAESMSINGGIAGASDLLLDGVPNTGTEGASAANMGFVPTPEATSQYKIQNSNYDAQYGRTSGGTMTVSVKNGTNKLHGALYYLNKNTVLTANSFDGNRAGSSRPAYHQSNPGLEFDGPLVIPHVYDGRNKTFFMWSYEIWRSAIPTPSTQTLPYQAAVHGDFNTTLQSNGTPITIYDPATTGHVVPPAAISRQHYSGQPHEPGGGQDRQLHSRAHPPWRHQQLHSREQPADGRLRRPRDPHRPADQRQAALLLALRARLPHRNQRQLRLAAGGRAGQLLLRRALEPGRQRRPDLRTVALHRADHALGVLPARPVDHALRQRLRPDAVGLPVVADEHPAALLPEHRNKRLPDVWGRA
jgi:hypothetical protein